METCCYSSSSRRERRIEREKEEPTPRLTRSRARRVREETEEEEERQSVGEGKRDNRRGDTRDSGRERTTGERHDGPDTDAFFRQCGIKTCDEYIEQAKMRVIRVSRDIAYNVSAKEGGELKFMTPEQEMAMISDDTLEKIRTDCERQQWMAKRKIDKAVKRYNLSPSDISSFMRHFRDEMSQMESVIEEVMEKSVGPEGETEQERKARVEDKEEIFKRNEERQKEKTSLALKGTGWVEYASSSLSSFYASPSGWTKSALLSAVGLISKVLAKVISTLFRAGVKIVKVAKENLVGMWNDPEWASGRIVQFGMFRRLVCKAVKRVLLMVISNQLQFTNEEAIEFETVSLSDLDSKTKGFFLGTIGTLARGTLMSEQTQQSIKGGISKGIEWASENSGAILTGAVATAGGFVAGGPPGAMMAASSSVKTLMEGKKEESGSVTGAVKAVTSSVAPLVASGVNMALEMQVLERTVQGKFDLFMKAFDFEGDGCGGILTLLCQMRTLIGRARLDMFSERLAIQHSNNEKEEDPEPDAEDDASEKETSTSIVSFVQSTATAIGGFVVQLAQMLWEMLQSLASSALDKLLGIPEVLRVESVVFTLWLPHGATMDEVGSSTFFSKAVVLDCSGVSEEVFSFLKKKDDKYKNNGLFASPIIESRSIQSFASAKRESKAYSKVTYAMILMESRSEVQSAVSFCELFLRKVEGGMVAVQGEEGKERKFRVKDRKVEDVRTGKAASLSFIEEGVEDLPLQAKFASTIFQMPHRRLIDWYDMNMRLWSSQVWCGLNVDEIRDLEKKARERDTASQKGTYVGWASGKIEDLAASTMDLVTAKIKHIANDFMEGGGIMAGIRVFDTKEEGAAGVANKIMTKQDGIVMKRIETIIQECKERGDFNRYFALVEFRKAVLCFYEDTPSSRAFDRASIIKNVRKVDEDLLKSIRDKI